MASGDLPVAYHHASGVHGPGSTPDSARRFCEIGADALEPAANFDQNDLIALMPQVRTFARSFCREPAQADDLSQEALVAAWRHRDRFTRGTNLRAWVFMILRNRFFSDQRRAWRTVQLDPELVQDRLAVVSHPTGALELDEVRRAMRGLADEQRQALLLVAVAGLAYNEAALICDCAAGTIKSRVSRARRNLQALLAEGDLAAEPRTPGHAMASILADATRLVQGADQARTGRAPCV